MARASALFDRGMDLVAATPACLVLALVDGPASFPGDPGAQGRSMKFVGTGGNSGLLFDFNPGWRDNLLLYLRS
ncbi:hypothetical protein CARN8_3760007 [mine drainage metagenome]|uniref:Uncharacterized protein n=1 Tax=mine drainage metagenome TaxID=410659 RepID=A0A3P3ZPA8_9ZZZZ